ncbi:MAG TPA: TetR-like C-terminal domain-containing protein [Acidimicrobiia bacterium]|nr:TetR-like C-terminal domain-containing protein [Acidimicrobiia bacterium]
MGVKVGLDRERVVAAAAELLESDPAGAPPTLATLAARLGVRTQSLYAHVDGADGLRRELALHALARLTERLRRAAIGVAGRDAIDGIVRAYVSFAAEHPGLYAASMRAPGDDPELRAAVAAAMEPLTVVFRSYGLDSAEASHWYRMVFSCVYGFAALRRAGLMTMPGDPDETLTRIVRVFGDQLERQAGVHTDGEGEPQRAP